MDVRDAMVLEIKFEKLTHTNTHTGTKKAATTATLKRS